MPATDDDGANDNRQRPIRMTNALWDDFGLVADVLKAERSALIRDFVRWSIGDDSVKAPRRPDVMPAGMRFVPLPPGVEFVVEGEVRQVSKPRTRYIVRVDADPEDVRQVLLASDEAKDALYTETVPAQISTFDRDHMLRILDAFEAAGMTVVTP